MRAGRLRHRLEIQTVTETLNTYGEPTKTWATDATRWGAIEPLTGRERFQANQVQAETTHTVRMRYYALSAKQRIKHGSRYFYIENVINTDERNIETIAMVKEDVS